MGQEEMVGYLMTQSNVTVPIRDGAITAGEIRRWLTQELAPFFASEAAAHTFRFRTAFHLLQRPDRAPE